MLGFLVSVGILLVLMTYWRKVYRAHEQRIEQLRVRIHVNGIRGKSTVTRLVAGVLREAGYQTIAKTTGSAARVIHEDGNESAIKRTGAATIIEQIDIIRRFVTARTDALVIECMAVNPLYQRVAQDQIVQGNITIITNVREDHQDVMGESLEEIADAMSNTIPQHGLLISAEERPHLRERLAANAQVRGSSFLYAEPGWVTDADLKAFRYLSFKENIAIGLAVARILNIPRDVAMRGMLKAIPDVGVVFVQRTVLKGKELIWAPLFAVNDRESTIMGIEALRPYHNPDALRIGILNNRYDRAVRAIQFAQIAACDLRLDYFITFGAYEQQVTERMVELGFPNERIINLGFSKNPTLAAILDQIVSLVHGKQAVLIGMVNIHTPQAELLMEYFHQLTHARSEHNVLITDLGHISEHEQRRRYLLSHLLRQRGTEHA